MLSFVLSGHIELLEHFLGHLGAGVSLCMSDISLSWIVLHSSIAKWQLIVMLVLFLREGCLFLLSGASSSLGPSLPACQPFAITPIPWSHCRINASSTPSSSHIGLVCHRDFQSPKIKIKQTRPSIQDPSHTTPANAQQVRCDERLKTREEHQQFSLCPY